MKVILECSVNQKQMAPNNLLGNNLYQLKLLAHCITFIMWPSPISLSNASGASEHRMLPTVLTGLRYWDKTGSRLGNDPVSLSGRLIHRTPSLWVQPVGRCFQLSRVTLPSWNWSGSRASPGARSLRQLWPQGKGWLEPWVLSLVHRTGPGGKAPWHCFGQVVGIKGCWGGGVFIYNLGFVCRVYCVLLWHVLVLLCFWVFLHNIQRHWSGHIIFMCQECRQCFSTKV